jgi:hypothetical protein
MNNQPKSSAPVRFPPGYGTPDPADLLPWSFAEERLIAARNYWVSTVGSGGVPHARPVDGVWVEGALCFGGSDKAIWVRNLEANPRISVHLPDDEDAIILEGVAERVGEATHPLAAPSTAATREKYPQYFSGDSPLLAEFQPFWALRPSVVYAWSLTGFPNRATRWIF